MKGKLFFASLLMFAVYAAHGQSNTNSTKTDEVTISLDNVAFEEGAYMSVLNSDNEVIALYKRFENQSGIVKSMRVFDKEKHLKFELVPIITETGFKIHIRDADKTRGLLSISASLSGFKMKFDAQVDYFGKPYGFTYASKIGIGKVRVNETVQYNGRDVISSRSKVSALDGVDVSPIVVDRTFYEENQLDVANWVLMLELLEEMSLESSRYNNARNTRLRSE